MEAQRTEQLETSLANTLSSGPLPSLTQQSTSLKPLSEASLALNLVKMVGTVLLSQEQLQA